MAAVGSVNGPSPGRTATGETRRKKSYVTELISSAPRLPIWSALGDANWSGCEAARQPISTCHVATGPHLSADTEGPAQLAVDPRSDQRTARSAHYPRGSPRCRQPVDVRQSRYGGFPAATLKLFLGSRVLEIDPVKQQIVWEYSGSDSDTQNGPSTARSSAMSDACPMETPSLKRA